MPGGSKEAFLAIQPIVEKVAAQVDDGPCTMYIGAGGAGNFVKMVRSHPEGLRQETGVQYGPVSMRLIALGPVDYMFGSVLQALSALPSTLLNALDCIFLFPEPLKGAKAPRVITLAIENLLGLRRMQLCTICSHGTHMCDL
jgi:hypothetical protein